MRGIKMEYQNNKYNNYSNETSERIAKYADAKKKSIAKSVAMNCAAEIVASVLQGEKEFSPQQAAEWALQLAKAFEEYLSK
jgi:hypothetical protein